MDFEDELMKISSMYEAVVFEETHWGNTLIKCIQGDAFFRYGKVCSIVEYKTGIITLLFKAKPKAPLKTFL